MGPGAIRAHGSIGRHQYDAALMAARTRSVTAPDGTVVGWHEAGRGDALLLVHAAAADARQWERLLPFLTDAFTVMALDRRGRGASGPLRPDHSLDAEAGDLAAVATGTDGPVHLFGHSSGARLALHAAPRIPNLASLMLYEPPAPEALSDAALHRLAQLEAAGDRDGILHAFFVDIVGNDEASFRALKERPVWPLMLDNALTVPTELRAVQGYRFDRARLATVPVPALLLLGGASGPELRHVVDELADALPDARFVTLPGQGHGAMFSAPELLASEIRRFVDTISRPR